MSSLKLFEAIIFIEKNLPQRIYRHAYSADEVMKQLNEEYAYIPDSGRTLSIKVEEVHT